ncbi:MAG: SgcJ/EcaC family oxidoreductase [Saprospiraceae bacterium]|nr:SgcJ/EcaC family oxidoreductase [Saprospiraceae bacterium]
MKNGIIAFFLISSHSGLVAQNQVDEQAIRDIVSDIATAWTNGDGPGFAEHFAEDHDFFVWNGIYMTGLSKSQNAENHQRIFDTMYKDTKHYAVIDKIRFVTEDVAVLTTMSAVVPKSAPAPEHPQVLWSATLVKNSGKWEIVSFHNADIEILDTADSRANAPFPVEVMFEKWYSASL